MMFVLWIFLYIFRFRNGKPQSTVAEGTDREGQSLTGKHEDTVLKDQLQEENELDNRQI